MCAAPTQSLLQKWLREEHEIQVYATMESLGSDEWGYSYEINYLPKEHQNAKRRVCRFEYIDSYKEFGSTYEGAWDTYEEALESALLEALKLI